MVANNTVYYTKNTAMKNVTDNKYKYVKFLR